MDTGLPEGRRARDREALYTTPKDGDGDGDGDGNAMTILRARNPRNMSGLETVMEMGWGRDGDGDGDGDGVAYRKNGQTMIS